MNKVCTLAFSMALAFGSGVATANPGNNGGGNGGCGVGQQTNGCGGGTVPTNPPSYNNNTANNNHASGGKGGNGYGGAGGQGGQGGAGGHGGTGGTSSVLGSGNSSNHNSNANLNTNLNTQGQNQGQGQFQGQGQGQGQGQNQTANGGQAVSGSNSASSSTSNSGGNIMTGGSYANTSANNVTVEGDTVNYEAQKRNPVSTAYSGPLTSANGTCMGSTSAGAQGIGFGLSFGSTWVDTSCDMRYDAEALRAAGLAGAARERLCQKPEIAKAMEDAGTPCKSSKTAQTQQYSQSTTVAQHDDGQMQYSDPIIRARLGLPPLK